ncbi:MAG: preprotein translocase subunit SecG [Candidatus Omnitrophota bacterium]|jgi:preprotein translocase subunit SecG
MFTLIVIVHVIACILLIALIMVQRGHGGGLVESFSDFESMFGTKTNAFLTRSTTVLSVIFIGTCLSLAVFSARQSKSLMEGAAKQQPAAAAAAQTPTQAQPQVPAQSQVPAQPKEAGAQQEKAK